MKKGVIKSKYYIKNTYVWTSAFIVNWKNCLTMVNNGLKYYASFTVRMPASIAG